MNEDLLARDDASRSAVANENASAAFAGEEPDPEAMLSVRGYRFLIEEDAEAARTDITRIEHLNRYLKGAARGNILQLYKKSIQNQIFSTPVGWEYLQELRGMLIDQGIDPDMLPGIPINVPITRRRIPGDFHVRERIAESPKEPMRFSLKTSIILNIVLILLVALMFFIANTSKSDNIINYRRNVINEYSTWAEDLTNREKAIREKERELGITHDGLPENLNVEAQDGEE